MKYLKQVNFIKKSCSFSQSSGDSRSWHWLQLGSGEDLMVEGRNRYKKERSHHQTKPEGETRVFQDMAPVDLRTFH